MRTGGTCIVAVTEWMLRAFEVEEIALAGGRVALKKEKKGLHAERSPRTKVAPSREP